MAKTEKQITAERARHDARVASEGPGDAFDVSPADEATFERMNQQTAEDRERAIAEGRRLFEQAIAQSNK
ncbi:MAG: hypothetical protein ACREAB_18015 [Blastocatellia bacterium]